MDVLPTELCIRILSELPISEAGISALIRCTLLGNSTLSTAALSPVLWEPHYERRYVHSDQTKEVQRRVTFSGNWRLLYQERRRIDHEARTALKALEGCLPGERAEHARRVVTHGLDVWDVLTEEDCRPLPPLLQMDEDIARVKDEFPLTNLCRKYWARELRNVIARRNAIDRWISLNKFIAGEENECASFEEAYATLSSFHGVLPSEILSHIERRAQRCKVYLDERGICYTPNSERFNVKKLCNAVCSYMQSQGFTRAGQMSFYDFRNSLPHLFLTSLPRSLPISLVFIFVGILKRLGVEEVTPVNTPGCVTALVRDTLVDVTRVSSEPDSVIGVVENYEGTRHIFGAPSQASLTLELLARAARNIAIAGFEEFGNESDEAHYATLKGNDLIMWLQAKYLTQVLRALSSEGPLHEPIVPSQHIRLFPLDMELVIQDKLLSIFPSYATYARKEDDDCVKEVPENIQTSEQLNEYFVGRIFSGSLCVVGWKKYGTGIRYSTLNYRNLLISEVALPSGPVLTTCSFEDVIKFHENPILGQFFEDAEFFETADGIGRGRGRFLMNKRMRRLYPDDDARGARWVRGEA